DTLPVRPYDHVFAGLAPRGTGTDITVVVGIAVAEHDRRLLFARAEHHPIAHGNDGLAVGIAAIAAVVTRRTRRGTNILALMSKSAGALSHAKIAGFAKIILPGIAGITAGRVVEHQRLVARWAAWEGLRADESRNL